MAELRATQLANPDYAFCDTVLVRVRVGKDFVYLNDSDQYAALGATAHDGQAGLVLPSGEFQNIAAAVDHRDRIETAYAIALQENGDATVRKTVRFFGDEFAVWNRKFSEMRPEERRRYHEEAVAAISQNAEADGEFATDFSSYPGVESFSVRVKRFAVRDGDYLYLAVPQSLSGLFDLRSDTRETPLYLAKPKRKSISIEVACPAGFEKVCLPQAFSCETLGGNLAISATEGPVPSDPAAGRQFSLVYSADLPAALVGPAAYGALFDLNRRISRVGAGMILLRRQSAPVQRAQ